MAALHYNENADRKQATSSDGRLQHSIRFPKYKKGGFTGTTLKEDTTYGTKFVNLAVKFHINYIFRIAR